jgi:biopolymer transport protein ExbD
MLFPEENDPPAQINIVPMIDVIVAVMDEIRKIEGVKMAIVTKRR